MKEEFVLDTSVAIAWYLPESFSPAAREWQRRVLDDGISLVVPGLHYWEFANVLRTYVRRGELNAEIASELYELHLDAPLSCVSPARETILDVALSFEATVYDAVYISLALVRDCRLLTAERTTTPWVVKLARQVVSIA